MSNFHATAEGQIPFTAEEEAEYDAMQIARTAELTELAKKQYQKDRAAEYPSIGDQLDSLFHSGIDGWKTTIQAVKNKYPKP